MKQIFLLLGASGLVAQIYGQGLVTFANTGTTLVYTNSASFGGTRGLTAPLPGSFIFALFTAPSTVTTVTAQDLLSRTWTFTGLYATNTAQAGRFKGGAGLAIGWPPGLTNSFAVLGWSTSAGVAWAQISAELNGAQFAFGSWYGGAVVGGAFYGLSAVSSGAAGGTDPATGQLLQPFPLFGALPNSQGFPLTTGFDLYGVMPEPSLPSFLILGWLTLQWSRRGSRLRRL
jgi:hypothetical protein